MFVQIPYGILKRQLSYLCWKHTIRYMEAGGGLHFQSILLGWGHSHRYKPDDKTTHGFSGKSIKRGLYRTKDGVLVNANITRKQKPADRQLCRGVLATPQRIHAD